MELGGNSFDRGAFQWPPTSDSASDVDSIMPGHRVVLWGALGLRDSAFLDFHQCWICLNIVHIALMTSIADLELAIADLVLIILNLMIVVVIIKVLTNSTTAGTVYHELS